MSTKVTALVAIYALGDIATFVHLIVADSSAFTWWNWIILIPIDLFLACIWPIYWIILVPLIGLPGR